jgi:hypothetical protein
VGSQIAADFHVGELNGDRWAFLRSIERSQNAARAFERSWPKKWIPWQVERNSYNLAHARKRIRRSDTQLQERAAPANIHNRATRHCTAGK